MKGVKNTGQSCKCGQELNSWDLRCNKALGYKHPICEKCIAEEYQISVDEVREHLEGFFGMLPCIGL